MEQKQITATYAEEYQGILPEPEELRKLM